jgi:hypothetical protein
MSRPPHNDKAKPQSAPVSPGGPARENDELEERIERLEKRLEETIDGIEGSVVRTGVDVDDKGKDDPLRRAVDRSNDKRDTDK